MDPQQLINDDITDNEELFGITEIGPDNDAPSDSFLPFCDIGYSLEDHRIIFNQKHPTNSQWRDLAPPNNHKVSATIDGTCQVLWNQAIGEINFVQTKVKNALGSKEPTLSNLLKLIFGPPSYIECIIEAKLEISNLNFCKHLGACSLAAANNLSKTQIFSKQSFINLEGLTNENDYKSFWDLIEEIGC
jgi:hypothetical protein